MAKVAKQTLSVSEQLEIARDGRTQRSIVAKMVAAGIEISETDFTNKKKYNGFTDEEVAKLSEILGVKIVKP